MISRKHFLYGLIFSLKKEQNNNNVIGLQVVGLFYCRIKMLVIILFGKKFRNSR